MEKGELEQHLKKIGCDLKQCDAKALMDVAVETWGKGTKGQKNFRFLFRGKKYMVNKTWLRWRVFDLKNNLICDRYDD